jgi:DNA-binding CsgD family transcriptional regulator
VTGHVITERSAEEQAAVVGPPDFVGRDGELARLTAALAGRPTVVLIQGEAGIGKSRLVSEYLAAAAGRADTVLVATCPPFRQPHTLGVIAHAIRGTGRTVAGLRLSALAGALRPLFPEWAAELPPASEAAEDATATRQRLFAALAELVAQLGISTLVVEDLHWGDETTLEFLLFLAFAQPCRMNLVATLRPEDLPSGSLLLRLTRLASGERGLRIALRPLDGTATASLVASMLGGDQVSGDIATIVHQRAEGIPLAAEELVRLMGERAVLADAGETLRRHVAEIGVPPTLRDTVLERLERLGPRARDVLLAAAVLGAPAAEAVITAVAGLTPEQTRTGLCEALSSSLLSEDQHGIVSFRHQLACQTVYEAAPGPVRRMLHLRAAQALDEETPEPAAALARHFWEAGQLRRWSGYAERAAGVAISVGDEATAIATLNALIAEANLPARRAAALLDRLTLAGLTDFGCCHELVRGLRQLLDRGDGDPRAEAELRFQLGRLLGLMKDYKSGCAELERAVPGLAHAPALAARAMNLLGWPYGLASGTIPHADWLRRAASLSSALGPTDRLRSLVDRGSAWLLLGDEEGWAAIARLPEDPHTAAERNLTTVGHLNAGDMAIMWGRYAAARRYLGRGLELAEAHQYHRYREMILTNVAHLDWLTGRWDGITERLRPFTVAQSQPGSRLEATMLTGLLHEATGVATCGETADRLERVLAEQWRRGESAYAAESSAALARLRLAAAQPAEALRITDAPLAVVTAKGTWVWAADLAPARVQALLAAGRPGDAASLVTAFSQGIQGRQAPAPQAAVILCRAMLAEARGSGGQAAALYARAATAWDALPRPYDALLARERQAHALITAGEPGRGVELLADVLRGLSQLGATTATARVARTLRENGTPARRPGAGRPSYGNRLSPRELDVVRLLVQGGTNRDIARQLFLSPNTVARHLSSAMRKLNVTSRASLAARVTERGLAGQHTGGLAGQHTAGLAGQHTGGGRHG